MIFYYLRKVEGRLETRLVETPMSTQPMSYNLKDTKVIIWQQVPLEL